ncbi:class I SAM-dependent methyltransferase [Microbulbifer sp. 2205BS26-8]|uniref:class I SAM-dependent methyltransferase n=1 Tax=Microbulbifer sp. 2205BS26-8 TaxID=3064386 RepID=UPI00273E85E8|nr:methyltransferase [Microbulbifer sp. 2205BS26-8]MDP5211163.1 methyltransferase [Microbulbifer sp. 2205BS26-8]
MSALLLQELLQAPRETLWIADENSKPLLQSGFHFNGDLLTNRWDIAGLAVGIAARSFFNDFHFEELSRSYRRIVYPVSKEKAVVHHIINQAPRFLGEGGELVLLGEKQSGIKSYAAKAAERLGTAKQLQKHGNDYSSINRISHVNGGKLIGEMNYPRLRSLPELGGLYSKPGLFGWNKIDRGSALLARQFTTELPKEGARIVDLGCGYGYLSIQLASRGNFHFTATDNNAAALFACKKNFRTLGLTGVVTPSDAGAELDCGIADLVLCNPPFHQGFQVEGGLTNRFLHNSARLLKSTGTTLFVVNAFISLVEKGLRYYSDVQLICKENGFCVYKLRL